LVKEFISVSGAKANRAPAVRRTANREVISTLVYDISKWRIYNYIILNSLSVIISRIITNKVFIKNYLKKYAQIYIIHQIDNKYY
jgi:hypothetical protein